MNWLCKRVKMVKRMTNGPAEAFAEVELLGSRSRMSNEGVVWSFPKFRGHHKPLVEELKKKVGDVLKPRREFKTLWQAVKFAEQKGFTFVEKWNR